MDHKNYRLLSRRGFLKTSLFGLVGFTAGHLIHNKNIFHTKPQNVKRIYIANDDHTDYMWAVDEETSQQAFIDMIDYYLDLADKTEQKSPENQSRFNLDGNFWVRIYENRKTKQEFERLIKRILDGHITVPLNPLNLLYGAMPTEAVIRSMYYAGRLERRFGINIEIVATLENQTLSYGIGALWAGAGARYSWKGVCGCATKINDLRSREHSIYWFTAPDGSRILMKWNSLLGGSNGIGGYAEARDLSAAIEFVETDTDFLQQYPYQVIGIFGRGWDDTSIFTDEFVKISETKSNETRKIIVSNEVDFFEDFERTYGPDLPEVSESYGNEWDTYTASLSGVSARVRRSIEKLRGAEALASTVSFNQKNFMKGRDVARDKAWLNMGLYYEHDWTADGPISREVRQKWQRQLAVEIENYVDALQDDGIAALGSMIKFTGKNLRFFVFNTLSWERTDYADFPNDNTDPIHVIDLFTGTETPSQFVVIDGIRKLRILAEKVPSIGYKVYEVRSGIGNKFPNAASVNNDVIEQKKYRLKIASRGAITSLVDKIYGNREFAREINGRVLNDLGEGTGTLEMENIGPVSCTILARSEKPLIHISRITLFKDLDRIEIRNEITQNFWSVFTWDFGFDLDRPEIWHEEVGAAALAKLTGEGGHYAERNARYDWLTLNHYANISDGLVGLTLSSADCSFMRLGNSSPNKLDSNIPLISVLAGGQTDGLELGIQGQGGDTHFLQRFAIATQEHNDQTAAMRFALEHQNPLITGKVTGGKDMPENVGMFLKIDNPQILLWAFKPADDGTEKGIVVRVWNYSPDPAKFTLEIPQIPILQIVKVTHIETTAGNENVSAGKLVASLNPWQMDTYLIVLSEKKLPGLLQQIQL